MVKVMAKRAVIQGFPWYYPKIKRLLIPFYLNLKLGSFTQHAEFDKGRSINDFQIQVCSRIQEILTSQSKNSYLLSNTQTLKSWTYFYG